MDKLSALWQGAAYQDKLLQSYRGFHLTTQSIFTAIGAGLTVAILVIDSLTKQLLIYGILFVISTTGIYLLLKMKKLIAARAEDVDYYHNRIIEYEKDFPKSEKVLTAFKVYQKYGRQKTDMQQFFLSFDLTDKVTSELTEKGKGHTRQFLDKNLFGFFLVIWLSFHAIALFAIISR